MADESLHERVGTSPDPERGRVEKRAVSLHAEQPTDDPVGQAEAMLADSDARTDDPGIRNLEDDRLERRTSDEATPPPD